MRKRLILLPVAVILWVFGWSFSWIGSQKALTKHTKTEKEPVSVNTASEILQEHEIRA